MSLSPRNNLLTLLPLTSAALGAVTVAAAVPGLPMALLSGAAIVVVGAGISFRLGQSQGPSADLEEAAPTPIDAAETMADEPAPPSREAIRARIKAMGVPCFKSDAQGEIEEVSQGLEAWFREYRQGLGTSDAASTAKHILQTAGPAQFNSTGGAANLKLGDRQICTQTISLEDAYITMVSDITGLDEGQAVLASGSSVLSATLDQAGTIVKASQAFAAALGSNAAALQGRGLTSLVTAADQTKVENARSSASGGCAAWFVGPSGTQTLLACTFARNARQQTMQLVAVDLGKASPALVEGAERLNALTSAQPMASLNAAGSLLWANKAFADLLGYTPDELEGMAHDQLVYDRHADDSDPAKSWSNLTNGQSLSGVCARKNRAGERVLMLARYIPVCDPQGSVTQVLVTAFDAASTAQAQQDAEEKNQALVAASQQFSTAILPSLDRLAKGDVKAPLAAPFPQGFQDICERYNKAIAQLGSTLGEAQTAVPPLLGNVEVMANAAEEMAQRTEGQAATLEQSAAALEELTSSVKGAAARTGEIEQEIKDAQTSARDGGTVVKEAVTAMSEIATSSNEISQIIGLIDDIAFQTNLLALNAGVEAARAGDAGRGFAVVASEVRALAQRSSDAAKQIKDLISKSASEVETGVALVDKTGTVLEGIINSIELINGRFREVHASTTEQAQGLVEVSSAVSQLDQVTQQNAAMAEENIAVGRELSDGMNKIERLLSTFSGGSRKSPVRTAPPKPQVASPKRRPEPVKPTTKAPAQKPAVLEQQARVTAAAAAIKPPAPASDPFEDDWTDF